MSVTKVELNDALLTEEHYGAMTSKEPAVSTIRRELARWKKMTTSEKIKAYVRLGIRWPLLLLRIREAQLTEQRSTKRVKWNREAYSRRQARKAARAADLALLQHDVPR